MENWKRRGVRATRFDLQKTKFNRCKTTHLPPRKLAEIKLIPATPDTVNPAR